MYHSQDNQDEILETYVFKGYKRGIVVDIGAWDGVVFSNSLFFEKERNWKSINIEPLEDRFKELVVNRPNSINLNMAISDVEGQAEFLAISGPTSMLSGIKSNYDERHIQRISNEMNELKTEAKTVTVSVRRLDSLFKEHKIQRVHYLSIDVEGSELNIIQSIDFEYTYIDVIGFENNYPDKTQSIVDYLKQKDYSILPKKSYDIFMIRNRSPFNPSF